MSQDNRLRDEVEQQAVDLGYLPRMLPGEMVYEGGNWDRLKSALLSDGFQVESWPVEEDAVKPVEYLRRGTVEVSLWADGLVRIPGF